MFKQEKERIKRLAYENAKREADNMVRVEKDLMRKKQFEVERKRKERMLSEAERLAKEEAAKEVTSEYERRELNQENVLHPHDNNDDDPVFEWKDSPVREGK